MAWLERHARAVLLADPYLLRCLNLQQEGVVTTPYAQGIKVKAIAVNRVVDKRNAGPGGDAQNPGV